MTNPVPFPAQPHGARPPEPTVVVKRRWTRSAMAVTGVLALTTAAGAYAAYDRSERVTERDTKIAALEAELGLADADNARLEAEITDAVLAAEQTAADAEVAILDVQTQVAAVTGERDVVTAQLTAYQGLFPLARATLDIADATGGYALAIAPRVDACVGYLDVATACGPDSFPSDLTIVFDPATGLRASSSWFTDLPLVDAGGRLTGSGPVVDVKVNQCNFTDVPTNIEVIIDRAGFAPMEGGVLKVTALTGAFVVSAPETIGFCEASSRIADFTGALT